MMVSGMDCNAYHGLGTVRYSVGCFDVKGQLGKVNYENSLSLLCKILSRYLANRIKMTFVHQQMSRKNAKTEKKIASGFPMIIASIYFCLFVCLFCVCCCCFVFVFVFCFVFFCFVFVLFCFFLV